MNTNSVQERIRAIVVDLGLGPDEYAVAGSGVMAMHGMDRVPGDIDIFVPTRVWFRLLDTAEWSVWTTDPGDPVAAFDPPYLTRELHGFTVDVFHEWRKRSRGNFDVAAHFAFREYVDGVTCFRLSQVLDWKRSYYRAKDAPDVAALEKWMGLDATTGQ